MPSSLPQLTIRMKPLLHKKIKYIAECNARSASREIELLIRKHIENFEKKHGSIELEDSPERGS